MKVIQETIGSIRQLILKGNQESTLENLDFIMTKGSMYLYILI